MSNRSGKTELPFGNDTHIFKLGYGQIKEIQDTTNAGIAFILDSLLHGTWKIEYIRETIRCGLVGGGMSPGDAMRMVKTYVEDTESYPIGDNIPIAASILAAAICGAEEEDKGKKPEAAGDNNSRRSNEEKSDSVQSMEPAP